MQIVQLYFLLGAFMIIIVCWTFHVISTCGLFGEYFKNKSIFHTQTHTRTHIHAFPTHHTKVQDKDVLYMTQKTLYSGTPQYPSECPYMTGVPLSQVN